MVHLKNLLVTSFVATCYAIDPAAIYDGGFGNETGSKVELRIGNGGAGQSGLVKGEFVHKTYLGVTHHSHRHDL